ncbi:septum formation family protein [Rugosimonospora africana]|uniref:Septum formation-related domain-containing protein n=1 Tax=Rugosimonospora africana TaxID=556532 RepID=A0A8J3QZB0_9ACTN|nr:septum formation family protein [Rugosimonospora africana]GIH19336.1 hypothetical protein Raf01_75080 [Rugosimonospora africana]
MRPRSRSSPPPARSSTLTRSTKSPRNSTRDYDDGSTPGLRVGSTRSFTGSIAGRSTAPAEDSPSRAVADAQCLTGAADYLGGDYHLGIFDLNLVLPSNAAWSGGARWFRCDLVRYTDANATMFGVTNSVKSGLRGSGPLASICRTITDDGHGSLTDEQLADCTQPHNSELAGLFTAPDLPWPSDEQARDDLASQGCQRVVAKYLGFSGGEVDSPYLGWGYESFTEAQWDLGDRTIRCSALGFHGASSNGIRFIGSVKGLRNSKPKGWHG